MSGQRQWLRLTSGLAAGGQRAYLLGADHPTTTDGHPQEGGQLAHAQSNHRPAMPRGVKPGRSDERLRCEPSLWRLQATVTAA
jgi:hypothetical protein